MLRTVHNILGGQKHTQTLNSLLRMHSKSTSMSVIYTFWTATPGAKPSEGAKEFHKPLNERRPVTPNCQPFETTTKKKKKKKEKKKEKKMRRKQ